MRRGHRGNKYKLDRLVAFSLYGHEEETIAQITAEFIRQINKLLAEEGAVTVDGLGRFRVISRPVHRPFNLSYTRRRDNKNINSVVATSRQLLVHFSKSTCLKAALKAAYKEDPMEKLGVDETTGHSPEQLEKLAAKGCPECGRGLTKHGNVLICPTHGSEPFEASHDPSVSGKHGND